MKNKLLLIFTILTISLVTSCSSTSNDLGREIPLINMDKELMCVDFLVLQNQDIIITSDEEYGALEEYKSFSSDCKDKPYPEIDFDKYILLGKYAAGGGCSINFKNNAYKTHSNKITYNIKVQETGNCEKLGLSMNWALIEKPDSDYTIEFLVE